MQMIRPWIVNNTRVEAKNRIFTLETRISTSPRTGRDHEFYVLQAGSWVNVIPVTPDERVVLVRQFRHGSREVTLEIPGGLVDHGQTPVQAGKRELLEETGYGAPEMTLLGKVRPNPAILDNWCWSYLALNAEPAADPDFDEEEDVETVLVPLADIPELIRKGEIDHALVLSAFFFYYHRQP